MRATTSVGLARVLDGPGDHHEEAPANFMLVVSYNPGYQNILKSLKPSTRQRFVSISFDFPAPDIETLIVATESGLAEQQCRTLVDLAQRIRALKDIDLEEVVSTRLLVLLRHFTARMASILTRRHNPH